MSLAVPTPVRLQLSRKKGFDLRAWSREVNGLEAVKVDRASRFGNPYRAARHPLYGWCAQGLGEFALACDQVDATRKAIRLFRQRAIERLDLSGLRGCNLACWCALDAPCHADVLLELANAEKAP